MMSYDMAQLRSPVGGGPPPVLYDRDVIRSPIDTQRKHISTGLHESEMF